MQQVRCMRDRFIRTPEIVRAVGIGSAANLRVEAAKSLAGWRISSDDGERRFDEDEAPSRVEVLLDGAILKTEHLTTYPGTVEQAGVRV